MTDNGSQATIIDKLMDLLVAYGLPQDDRASFRAAIEVYVAMAIPSEVAGKPPATRSQALRAAGFTPRERMTGAGGLVRDKFKDDPVPWKVGDEFAPFHPSASHVTPDYRDGWNDCYRAALAAAAPNEKQ